MEKQVFAGVTNVVAAEVLNHLLDSETAPDVAEAKTLESIPGITDWADQINRHISDGTFGSFGDVQTLILGVMSLGMRYQAALATHATKRTKTRVSGGAA